MAKATEAKAAEPAVTQEPEAPEVQAAPKDPYAPYAKGDRVRVKLMKDSKDYRDDVTICVNGHAIKIQRGVYVDIPRAHYEVLLRSMGQDQMTAELITETAGKYENAVNGNMM